MKHLIIIINPLPKLYIESLIKKVAINKDDVYIFTFYKKVLISTDFKEHIKNINKGVNIKFYDYIYQNLLIRYLFLLKCILKINTISDKSSVYYIVHPNHIITNYILFTLAPKYSSEVNLIPDGIANYYSVDIKPYKKNMFFKSLVSRLALIRYKNYTGDYIGLEEDLYEKHFYINPYIPVSSKSSKKIPLQIPFYENKDIVNNSLLILGFDFKPKELAKEYIKVYKKFLDKREGVFKIIHYKPHPSENISKELFIFLNSFNIKIIENDAIAEDIMHKYSSVIGIFSSSLVNARIMSNRINLICLYPSCIKLFMPFVSLNELNKLNNIFKKLNIEIVRI